MAAVAPLCVDDSPLGHAMPEWPGRLDRLEELRFRLQAGRVALVRFHRATGGFEVAAATGVPFLAAGVRLPVAASAALVLASEGRRACVSLEHSARPLERIAASIGLRSSVALPLTVAGVVVGALTALWETDPPPISEPYESIRGAEVALLGMLIAPEPNRHHFLVCHEDDLVAQGLAHIAEQRLGSSTDIASSVTQALAALAARSPDLIICSDRLSDSEHLPEVVRRLRAAGAAAPLVVVARKHVAPGFERALSAGASGYLPLVAAAEQLPHAAAAVLSGRTLLHEPSPRAEALARLTRREQDVLLGFERGLCDKEIAQELGVAISTVKTHARSIYGKLDVASRTAALHKARRVGLI
jgi:DNA-binding NarL/FixJ family response regulator